MDNNPLEWVLEVPPVTRSLMAGMLVTSILESNGIISKTDCFYSVDYTFRKGQYYRALTTFLYFGPLTPDLAMTLMMVGRHSGALEQSFSRRRDYAWCIFLLSSALLIYASLAGNIYILSTHFNDVLLYIWCKQNSGVPVGIPGILTFKAGYLPFVQILFDKFVNGVTSFGSNISIYDQSNRFDMKVEFCGIIIGHLFVFAHYIMPTIHPGLDLLKPIWEWGR